MYTWEDILRQDKYIRDNMSLIKPLVWGFILPINMIYTGTGAKV